VEKSHLDKYHDNKGKELGKWKSNYDYPTVGEDLRSFGLPGNVKAGLDDDTAKNFHKLPQADKDAAMANAVFNMVKTGSGVETAYNEAMKILKDVISRTASDTENVEKEVSDMFFKARNMEHMSRKLRDVSKGKKLEKAKKEPTKTSPFPSGMIVPDSEGPSRGVSPMYSEKPRREGWGKGEEKKAPKVKEPPQVSKPPSTKSASMTLPLLVKNAFDKYFV
jgi:hypothetical protein